MEPHRSNRTHNPLGQHPFSFQGKSQSMAPGQKSANQSLNDHSRRQRFLPYKSHRNYRTIKGTDAGLNLRHSKGRKRRLFGRMTDTQVMYLLLGVSAVILIVLLLLVGSCASSCVKGWMGSSSKKEEVNAIDSRVNAKASENITQKLIPALNYSDAITWISQHTDQYKDERLIELAINEPAAAAFVSQVPSAKAEASAYTDEVTQGTVPCVYNWNEHWGFVPFGSSILGVNGSGLTSLFMADAYLTGSKEHTPDVLAQAAASYADDTLGVSAAFFNDKAKDFGLTVKELAASADNLKLAVSDGKVALVQLKEGFTSPYAHWALISGMRKDGSVVMFDPTSEKATNTSWALGTVGDNISQILSLSVKAQEKSKDN